MEKKKKGIILLGILVLLVMGIVGIIGNQADKNAKVTSYEVTLPMEYNEASYRYPVVYVMPQDGYSVDNSGITEKLQSEMDAIIVRPSFEEGLDIHSAMKNLVKEIDKEYRTVADKKYRGIVGTGTGGYLAYILGLTDSVNSVVSEAKLFSAIASIRGDFVSDENPEGLSKLEYKIHD